MSSDTHQRVAKLKGRENYDTWKIACKSYLVIKELWTCIEKEPDENKAKEVEKDLKAWSELSLLIHENLYSYIANTDTAKEAWTKLERSFEDSGLCRKVELLKQLVQMTLDTCESVEEYVSKMVTTSLKVEKAVIQGASQSNDLGPLTEEDSDELKEAKLTIKEIIFDWIRRS